MGAGSSWFPSSPSPSRTHSPQGCPERIFLLKASRASPVVSFTATERPTFGHLESMRDRGRLQTDSSEYIVPQIITPNPKRGSGHHWGWTGGKPWLCWWAPTYWLDYLAAKLTRFRKSLWLQQAAFIHSEKCCQFFLFLIGYSGPRRLRSFRAKEFYTKKAAAILFSRNRSLKALSCRSWYQLQQFSADIFEKVFNIAEIVSFSKQITVKMSRIGPQREFSPLRQAVLCLRRHLK